MLALLLFFFCVIETNQSHDIYFHWNGIAFSTGGRTPWGSWISCEEWSGGQCWQTDPEGNHPPRVTAFGIGYFESFTFDIERDPFGQDKPTFYVTEDTWEGALRRLTPDNNALQSCYNNEGDNYERWCSLESGTLEFLVMHADSTFYWSSNITEGRESAWNYFPNAEGIDSYGGKLYFTSKYHKTLIILDLREMTWSIESTQAGEFSAQPDQIRFIVGDDGDNQILYMVRNVCLLLMFDRSHYVCIVSKRGNGMAHQFTFVLWKCILI